MKKTKGHIDTYKSMYPVLLVVANKDVTIEELRKQFLECDGTELQDDDMNRTTGIVIRAIRKSDERAVILVRMNGEDSFYKDKLERKIEFISRIAHEAAHVALTTYERIDEQVCDKCQEPFAYYIGWIVECICKTVFKK